MQLDKYEKRQKEYLRLETEYNEKYACSRRYRSSDPRPMTFVPLEEKEFLGWEISVHVKTGYVIHEKLVEKIVNYFLRPDITRSLGLLRLLRSKNRSFVHCQKPMLKFFYNKRTHSYDLPSYMVIYYEFHKYKYEHFLETLTEEEKPIAKLFFYRYFDSYNLPKYTLKVSHDSHQSYHIPINLLYYKITKSYITEIGLLDRQWERKHSELKNAVYGYRYYEVRNRYSRYRSGEMRQAQKAINNSYTRLFNEIKKHDNVVDEDMHLSEAQRCKFFRRAYFKHKWNF